MPGSLAICEDESDPNRRDVISLRAFEKWIARGHLSDASLADWLEAESEVRQLLVLTRQVQELERCLADQLSAIKQSQRRLTAEHDVARILSVSATLVEAAPDILRSICESLDYGLGVLWVVDHEAQVLRCAEVFELEALDVGEIAEVTRERVVGFGEGLPGRVWASQSAMAMSDEDSLSPLADASICLQNAIAFPVRNGVEFLGVMEFLSRDMREEDQAIVEMMASIGRQISQFIERRNAEAAMRGEQEQRRVAGCIQQRLLPQRKPVLPGYDVSGRCMSAFDVGGDCFDYIPMTVGCDNCLGILVADASGHGLGAALFAAETRAYVRALAMTCPDVDRLLSLVNQRIADEPGREGFVTATLLRLAPRDGAVVYANAGHCPPIVFNSHGEVRGKLAGTGFPLGIDPAAAFVAEFESLAPGELLLLFSDGTIEACSPDGELFGIRRLLDSVKACWNESTDRILDAVFHDVVGFYEGRTVRDDITVVVIRRQEIRQDHQQHSTGSVESMEQSHLLVVAMAEQCRGMIQQAGASGDGLPAGLHPRHLLWMCDRIEQHAEDWPSTKLHRWIGFVQAGMMANQMLDLKGAKAMFDNAKTAHGEPGDDPDLVDHLDPDSSFEMDLGGQG